MREFVTCADVIQLCQCNLLCIHMLWFEFFQGFNSFWALLLRFSIATKRQKINFLWKIFDEKFKLL